MKRRLLILIAALAALALSHASAAMPKVRILSTREMAAIEGSFCLIQKCETGTPSGKCETIPPESVCAAGTCTFRDIPLLIGDIEVCSLLGHYTCDGTEGYRKCIMGKLWDVCWYSSINVCGEIVQPACAEDIQEHTCTCHVDEPGEPCDWTNCLLESQ